MKVDDCVLIERTYEEKEEENKEQRAMQGGFAGS
jgi:hypothetical protein